MTWPFENNTNAITGKLAKRSLQADKKKYFSDCDDHINNCSFVWYIFYCFCRTT